jgi:hypothetical protein
MQVNKTYVEADWATGNATAPIALNHRGGVAAVEIIVTGTVNFDIQSTNSDLQAGESASWLVDSTETTGITASKWITYTATPRFVRVLVNSFTTGATIALKIAQSDA